MNRHPITPNPMSRHSVKKHTYMHTSVAATAFPNTNFCTRYSKRTQPVPNRHHHSSTTRRLACTHAACSHDQQNYQPARLERKCIPKQRVDSEVFGERRWEHCTQRGTNVSLPSDA